jgi:hypothetical protein
VSQKLALGFCFQIPENEPTGEWHAWIYLFPDAAASLHCLFHGPGLQSVSHGLLPGLCHSVPFSFHHSFCYSEPFQLIISLGLVVVIMATIPHSLPLTPPPSSCNRFAIWLELVCIGYNCL